MFNIRQHKHTHTCTHARARAHTHTHTHTHAHTHTHTHTHTRTHARTHTYTHTRTLRQTLSFSFYISLSISLSPRPPYVCLSAQEFVHTLSSLCFQTLTEWTISTLTAYLFAPKQSITLNSDSNSVYSSDAPVTIKSVWHNSTHLWHRCCCGSKNTNNNNVTFKYLYRVLTVWIGLQSIWLHLCW